MEYRVTCDICGIQTDRVVDVGRCNICEAMVCVNCITHTCRGKIPRPMSVESWNARQMYIKAIRRVMNVK